MERYLSFSEACKNRYGRRLYKVALDAGMTCPNRDGTCGTGGCIFCSGRGSGEFAIRFDGQKLHREDLVYNHQDAEEGDYIAYFQAFTNTYDRPERLARLYRAALDNDLFAGISIATRPDCLGKDVMDLLKKLKQEYPDKLIWTELGLQSMHEETAAYIRRGYPLKVFDEAVKELHEAGIEVIVHVIIGLPHEDKEMMLATIRHLSSLPVDGVKLQLLHYLADSDLGKAYLLHPEDFHVLSLQEYADIICACIKELRSDIVIHRLSGDGSPAKLLAPLWSKDKKRVLNTIRHELKTRNIRQGEKQV